MDGGKSFYRQGTEFKTRLNSSAKNDLHGESGVSMHTTKSSQISSSKSHKASLSRRNNPSLVGVDQHASQSSTPTVQDNSRYVKSRSSGSSTTTSIHTVSPTKDTSHTHVSSFSADKLHPNLPSIHLNKNLHDADMSHDHHDHGRRTPEQKKNSPTLMSPRQLERLATFFEDVPVKFPEPKKIVFPPCKVRTFYVEKWPEPEVRLDNTVVPIAVKSCPVSQAKPLLGGMPITVDIAKELRCIVYGSSIQSFSLDWRRCGLALQNIDGVFPFGLITPKMNGPRAVVLAVQGHLLRHLLFDDEALSDFKNPNNLRPPPWKRRNALVSAMCDMLWRAGDEMMCCTCLPQDEPCFSSTAGYREDGITEKLHQFKFRKYEDLEAFIKRYYEYFESEVHHGCILFLYSLALSRGFHQLRRDMGVEKESKEKLVTDLEECSTALINLLLTGRAVRYLHNGSSLYNDDGHLMSRAQQGVEERSQVGHLYFDKAESSANRTQVGSMLKTPKFPIWLTTVNGRMGMLFCTNPDLVSHWRVEHRFTLHYYTGLTSESKQTCITVDTRFKKRVKTALARRGEEEKYPALERCILTKWYGADINWNGTAPFY